MSLSLEMSPDVLHDPRWPLFLEVAAPDSLHLGVISINAYDTDDPLGLLSRVLESVLLHPEFQSERFHLDLFVTQSTWQPDTRIVRHYGMWKGLKRKGVTTAFVADGAEAYQTSPEGLRFSGLGRVPLSHLKDAIAFLNAQSTSSLILTRQRSSVPEERALSLMASAFLNPSKVRESGLDWASLAVDVCSAGDILVRLSKLKDETDMVVDLFSSRCEYEILQRILASGIQAHI